MAEKFNGFENYFVIDSMPLEVCKMARSSRSKICKEAHYAVPNKGFCASLNWKHQKKKSERLQTSVLSIQKIQKTYRNFILSIM